MGWLLTLAALAAWVVFLRPQALGGPAAFVAVDGTSMTPTMRNGDLAFVEKEPAYRLGDTVAYRIPSGQPGAGTNIIHRIVAGDGTSGFVTKGDHNTSTDYFWHPKTADIVGRVWFHVPGAAAWMARLHQPGPLALVVGVVTFALIAWPCRRRAEAGAPPAEPVEPSIPQWRPRTTRRGFALASAVRVGCVLVAIELAAGVVAAIARTA